MSGLVTYNAPSQKMNMTANFRLVAMCRVEMTGMGRQRIATSRAMLVPTWAYPKDCTL